MHDVQRRPGRSRIGNDLLHPRYTAGVLDEPGRAQVHEDRSTVTRRHPERMQDLLARRRRRVIDAHADA